MLPLPRIAIDEVELAKLQYCLATRIYNKFQLPLRQILQAHELLVKSNDLTKPEHQQQLQVIKDSVQELVESLDNFVKDLEASECGK